MVKVPARITTIGEHSGQSRRISAANGPEPDSSHAPRIQIPRFQRLHDIFAISVGPRQAASIITSRRLGKGVIGPEKFRRTTAARRALRWYADA
jgi:hypothetical protein